MLHEHIKHYTARIDYNQDLFIYLYMYICMYIFVYQSLPVNGEGFIYQTATSCGAQIVLH